MFMCHMFICFHGSKIIDDYIDVKYRLHVGHNMRYTNKR